MATVKILVPTFRDLETLAKTGVTVLSQQMSNNKVEADVIINKSLADFDDYCRDHVITIIKLMD